MIKYIIGDNNGFGKVEIRQDYDLAMVIVSVEDRVAKVPIVELEKVLKAIKGETE